jgi:hypothetical protein
MTLFRLLCSYLFLRLQPAAPDNIPWCEGKTEMLGHRQNLSFKVTNHDIPPACKIRAKSGLVHFPSFSLALVDDEWGQASFATGGQDVKNERVIGQNRYVHGKRVGRRNDPSWRVTDSEIKDLAFLHEYVQRRHDLFDGRAVVPLDSDMRGYEHKTPDTSCLLTQCRYKMSICIKRD